MSAKRELQRSVEDRVRIRSGGVFPRDVNAPLLDGAKTHQEATSPPMDGVFDRNPPPFAPRIASKPFPIPGPGTYNPQGARTALRPRFVQP